MGRWVETPAELLLLAPGHSGLQAARGSPPGLSRDDQIFQPHSGEPGGPGLTRMNRGDGQTPHPPGASAPLDRCEPRDLLPSHGLFRPCQPHCQASLPLGLGSPSVSSWVDDGWGPVSARLRVDFVCV